MPIPFLLIGAAGLLGGIGVAAGLDAKEIYDRAKRIAEDARGRINYAVENFEYRQYELDAKIDEFNTFIQSVDRDVLGKLEKLTEKINLHNELKYEYISLNRQLYDVLQDRNTNITVSNTFYDAVSSIATGAVASIATPTLLVSLATTIGTASTGTAISALTGVAAKNAALAWLGGGALSAGGMGMAGGLLLSNIATFGVGILIGGIVLNVKAEKALTQAEEYSSEVDLEINRINGYIMEMDIIKSKIDYHLENSARFVNLIHSCIDKVNVKRMKKNDVTKVMNAIVIYNKYREILSSDLSDMGLCEIRNIYEAKLNDALSIIKTIEKAQRQSRFTIEIEDAQDNQNSRLEQTQVWYDGQVYPTSRLVWLE